MKSLILALTLVLSSSVFADSSTPCQKKVTAAIRGAAKAAGLKGQYGFELSEAEAAGPDVYGGALDSYSSSLFFIEDGYISNSGAAVVVRHQTCEIIKVNQELGS